MRNDAAIPNSHQIREAARCLRATAMDLAGSLESVTYQIDQLCRRIESLEEPVHHNELAGHNNDLDGKAEEATDKEGADICRAVAEPLSKSPCGSPAEIDPAGKSPSTTFALIQLPHPVPDSPPHDLESERQESNVPTPNEPAAESVGEATDDQIVPPDVPAKSGTGVHKMQTIEESGPGMASVDETSLNSSEPAAQEEAEPAPPSLDSIMMRLRKPVDTESPAAMFPQMKSLSDEDLLGLEMIELSQPSMALDESPADIQPANEVHREPRTNEVVAAKPAVSSETRIDAEAIYNAALHGRSPQQESAERAGKPPVEGDRHLSRIIKPEDIKKDDLAFEAAACEAQNEDQTRFVHSNIQGSNLEKLDALRAQLQQIFSRQANLESGLRIDTQITVPCDFGEGGRANAAAEEKPHDPTTPAAVETEVSAGNSPDDEVFPINLIDPPSITLEESSNMPSTSATDVLSTAAFLKDINLYDDDDQENLNIETSAESPKQEAPTEPPAPTVEEDHDVQGYMHQLMARLRGESPSPKEKTEVKTEVAAPRPAPAVVPMSEDEFVPKSQAPERAVNIDALRNLANESTRHAVTAFAKHQKKAVYVTQLAVIGCGATGTVLFSILASSLGPAFYLLSAGSMVAAMFAGYRFYAENIVAESQAAKNG